MHVPSTLRYSLQKLHKCLALRSQTLFIISALSQLVKGITQPSQVTGMMLQRVKTILGHTKSRMYHPMQDEQEQSISLEFVLCHLHLDAASFLLVPPLMQSSYAYYGMLMFCFCLFCVSMSPITTYTASKHSLFTSPGALMCSPVIISPVIQQAKMKEPQTAVSDLLGLISVAY